MKLTQKQRSALALFAGALFGAVLFEFVFRTNGVGYVFDILFLTALIGLNSFLKESTRIFDDQKFNRRLTKGLGHLRFGIICLLFLFMLFTVPSFPAFSFFAFGPFIAAATVAGLLGAVLGLINIILFASAKK